MGSASMYNQALSRAIEGGAYLARAYPDEDQLPWLLYNLPERADSSSSVVRVTVGNLARAWANLDGDPSRAAQRARRSAVRAVTGGAPMLSCFRHLAHARPKADALRIALAEIMLGARGLSRSAQG